MTNKKLRLLVFSFKAFYVGAIVAALMLLFITAEAMEPAELKEAFQAEGLAYKQCVDAFSRLWASTGRDLLSEAEWDEASAHAMYIESRGVSPSVMMCEKLKDKTYCKEAEVDLKIVKREVKALENLLFKANTRLEARSRGEREI
jgi:hypothetical protein